MCIRRYSIEASTLGKLDMLHCGLCVYHIRHHEVDYGGLPGDVCEYRDAISRDDDILSGPHRNWLRGVYHRPSICQTRCYPIDDYHDWRDYFNQGANPCE